MDPAYSRFSGYVICIQKLFPLFGILRLSEVRWFTTQVEISGAVEAYKWAPRVPQAKLLHIMIHASMAFWNAHGAKFSVEVFAEAVSSNSASKSVRRFQQCNRMASNY